MNNRDNYLALITHEKTPWIPCISTDTAMVGGKNEVWENGPITGGFDAFGNNWIPTASAGGASALDPSIIPLDNVCDWEDKVAFPNLDAIDWQELADRQLATVNRAERVVEYHSWHSVFLRLTYLLGYEEALVAFYEEPEATKALCEAIADYKIAVLERAAKYYKPDAYVHYDDFATENNLFISPDIYRAFIKPAHTRMNDAARDLGIIPIIHICGKCEEVIPDVIEEGSQAWQSAQPMNDLERIIETYGDRFSVLGGFNTQGHVALPESTDEEIIAEVDRCIETYGRFGRGYGFFGFFAGDRTNPAIAHKSSLMISRVLEKGGSPFYQG